MVEAVVVDTSVNEIMKKRINNNIAKDEQTSYISRIDNSEGRNTNEAILVETVRTTETEQLGKQLTTQR